jgi:hypothetical protein
MQIRTNGERHILDVGPVSVSRIFVGQIKRILLGDHLEGDREWTGINNLDHEFVAYNRQGALL